MSGDPRQKTNLEDGEIADFEDGECSPSDDDDGGGGGDQSTINERKQQPSRRYQNHGSSRERLLQRTQPASTSSSRSKSSKESTPDSSFRHQKLSTANRLTSHREGRPNSRVYEPAPPTHHKRRSLSPRHHNEPKQFHPHSSHDSARFNDLTERIPRNGPCDIPGYHKANHGQHPRPLLEMPEARVPPVRVPVAPPTHRQSLSPQQHARTSQRNYLLLPPDVGPPVDAGGAIERKTSGFHCRDCRSDFPDEANYRKHLTGKKHERVVKNHQQSVNKQRSAAGSRTRAIATDKPAKIQAELEACPEAMIGCEFVEEYLPVNPRDQPSYYCSLCGSQAYKTTLFKHLAGHKHRITYLEEIRSDLHAQVTILQEKSKQVELVSQFARQLFRDHGTGTVKQKQEPKVYNTNTPPLPPPAASTSALASPSRPSVDSPVKHKQQFQQQDCHIPDDMDISEAEPSTSGTSIESNHPFYMPHINATPVHQQPPGSPTEEIVQKQLKERLDEILDRGFKSINEEMAANWIRVVLAQGNVKERLKIFKWRPRDRLLRNRCLVDLINSINAMIFTQPPPSGTDLGDAFQSGDNRPPIHPSLLAMPCRPPHFIPPIPGAAPVVPVRLPVPSRRQQPLMPETDDPPLNEPHPPLQQPHGSLGNLPVGICMNDGVISLPPPQLLPPPLPIRPAELQPGPHNGPSGSQPTLGSLPSTSMMAHIATAHSQSGSTFAAMGGNFHAALEFSQSLLPLPFPVAMLRVSPSVYSIERHLTGIDEALVGDASEEYGNEQCGSHVGSKPIVPLVCGRRKRGLMDSDDEDQATTSHPENDSCPSSSLSDAAPPYNHPVLADFVPPSVCASVTEQRPDTHSRFNTEDLSSEEEGADAGPHPPPVKRSSVRSDRSEGSPLVEDPFENVDLDDGHSGGLDINYASYFKSWARRDRRGYEASPFLDDDISRSPKRWDTNVVNGRQRKMHDNYSVSPHVGSPTTMTKTPACSVASTSSNKSDVISARIEQFVAAQQKPGPSRRKTPMPSLQRIPKEEMLQDVGQVPLSHQMKLSNLKPVIKQESHDLLARPTNVVMSGTSIAQLQVPVSPVVPKKLTRHDIVDLDDLMDERVDAKVSHLISDALLRPVAEPVVRSVSPTLTTLTPRIPPKPKDVELNIAIKEEPTVFKSHGAMPPLQEDMLGPPTVHHKFAGWLCKEESSTVKPASTAKPDDPKSSVVSKGAKFKFVKKVVKNSVKELERNNGATEFNTDDLTLGGNRDFMMPSIPILEQFKIKKEQLQVEIHSRSANSSTDASLEGPSEELHLQLSPPDDDH